MLSEDTLKALAEPIAYRLERFNDSVLEKIGNKINEIGKVNTSDLQKLNRLKDYGADVNKIKAEFARITNLNTNDIEYMFATVARESELAMDSHRRLNKTNYIPISQNKDMQAFIIALANMTKDTYINLSQTTGFMIYKDKNKVFTSMSKIYSEVIDRAIIAVSTGTEGYYSAMRQTLRDLADSGIRTQYTPLHGRAGKLAEYATGYTRRLDTAVRQNILWGAKQCAQGIMEQVGEEIGADGYEIDYHPNPRPSHAEMGGRRYAIGRGKRVNGIYYPSISTVQHLLDDYNCLHIKTPVILGVSVPAFDEAELKRLKARDKETIEYEGREYTGYEATQMQRRLETSIRHAKDRQIIAAAAGDDVLRREEQAKLNVLSHKYKDFTDATGLPTKAERAAISGYHRVRTFDEMTDKEATKLLNSLTNEQKIAILKGKIERGEMSLKINPEKQSRHINPLDNRSYFTIDENELQEIVFARHCTGKIWISNKGKQIKEVVDCQKNIGVCVDKDNKNNKLITNFSTIHYSKTGSHLVPAKGERYEKL